MVKVTWAAAVTEDEMDLRRKHSHKAMPNEREWFVNSASALSKAVGDLADAQALNH